MTFDQVEWCLRFDWYRSYERIGMTLFPAFRVKANINGLNRWYTDFNKLVKDTKVLENAQ